MSNAAEKERQAEYRKKRSEDPERRKRYSQQVSQSIMKKYNTDPEWRDEYNRKRRERYNEKKKAIAMV